MEAGAEFYSALAAAQAEFDLIDRSGKVDFKEGQSSEGRKFRGKSYSYATLGGVIAMVREPLAKNGLGFIQEIHDTPGRPDTKFIITRVFHSSGQFIVSPPFGCPPAENIQEIGSVTTYAKRYCLMAILGLAPMDEEDDDGRASMKGQSPRRDVPYDQPRQPSAPANGGGQQQRPADLPGHADRILQIDDKENDRGPFWRIKTEREGWITAFSDAADAVITARQFLESGEFCLVGVDVNGKYKNLRNVLPVTVVQPGKQASPPAAASPPTSAPPPATPTKAPPPPKSAGNAAQAQTTRATLGGISEQKAGGKVFWKAVAFSHDNEEYDFFVSAADLHERWQQHCNQLVDIVWFTTPRGNRQVSSITEVLQPEAVADDGDPNEPPF